jgi:putative tryptophan/tyrosine transport system substrate-binding protein
MRRRSFVKFAGSMLVGWPLAAHAQQPGKTYRIATLSLTARPSQPVLIHALAAHGYVEGRNTLILSRSAEGEPERMPELAAEIIGFQPDVIIAGGGQAADALRQATTTIPIVLWEVGDPVGLGLVTNIAHPGANITGVTELSTELTGKRLQLLKEAVPTAARVAIIWNGGDRSMELRARASVASAPELGITIVQLPVENVGEIDATLVALAGDPPDAVIVVTDPLTARRGKAMIDFFAAHRLPSMYEYQAATRAGVLLAYGPDMADLAPIAADYVDKILHGAKPADLPLVAPDRFYFRVNTQTARKLGITVPSAILARADEVIE